MSNPHTVTSTQVLPSQTGNADKVLGTDGTTASWVAAASGGTDLTKRVIVREETAGNGGTFTAGSWLTRTLNTEHYNGITGASLAGNQLTLPAGTYLMKWSAPAYKSQQHCARLYNVTDSAVVDYGISEYNAAGDAVQTRSIGKKVVTIASAKAFRVEHYCQDTQATNGWGVEHPAVAYDIYTILEAVLAA